MGKAGQVARRLFTVEEYHRMGEAGIIGPEDRVELLEGEIVTMSPIGSEHAACVNRLTQFFVQRLAGRAIVCVQNPVSLGDHSEPEPDIALLRPRPDFYAGGHPRPKDVLLLVEVSDTTRQYDRDRKVPAYAGAGIAEVWIVEVPGQCVELFREPRAGGYGQVQTIRRGQDLTPSAFPDVRIGVDEILG